MLVKDWMSKDPITINDDTSMMKAIHLMKQNRFRRLPVLQQGRLVGIVSDRDLKEASPSKATTLDVHELYYLLSELQVKDIMTRDPIPVAPDDTVEHAAQLMLENTISGLPVVDEKGAVVGILTQSDVFRSFMYRGSFPPVWELGVMAGTALAVLALGVWVFSRAWRSLVSSL